MFRSFGCGGVLELGGRDYYGYGWRGPITTTTDVIEYGEDTLIVDVWDARSKELVLRGSVTRVLADSPARAQLQVDKAITKMAKRAEKLMAAKR